MRAALPVLPAVLRSTTCRRAARRPTIPSGARSGSFNAIPRNPRKPYKMRAIVEAVVDRGSFFEMSALYGRAVITGFARLDGWPVAVMASDPFFYGGAWTADTCQKVERFVDTAQTFHLPIVYLVDCPGFLIGLEAEKTGTIKQGVRAMSAIWQSTRAMVRGDHPQRVRRGRRRPPQRQPVLHALRVAVGPLGLAAARGRHRGGLPRRPRRAPRIRWPRWPRSRSG